MVPNFCGEILKITGLSDPFCSLKILPDKQHKEKTNIKYETLNPKWNELFTLYGNVTY